jgi:hypothetical protein
MADLMEESIGNSAARTSLKGRSFLVGLCDWVLSRLCAVMVKLRGKQSRRENLNQTKDFICTLIYASLNVLQLISLATSCDLGAEEFAFWSILRYTRLEWIAYKTDSLWHFIVVAQAVVLTQFCLFIAAMASLTHVPKVSCLALAGLKAACHPSSSMIVIPFQMALLTSIKYTFSSKSTVLEFEDLPVGELKVSAATCMISMLCFVVLLALEYIKLVTNSKIGYAAHLDHEFRFTSRFDALLRLGFTGLLVLYFFTDLMHSIVYRGVTAGVGLYFAGKVREALPYSIDRMNHLYFAVCILLAWAAAAVQVGENLGNVLTSCLLLVVIGPLVVLGSYNALQKRLTNAGAKANRLITKTKHFQEFELSLRFIARAATTPQEKDVVMDHFIDFRARSHEAHKMVDICEVYFCIDALQNNKLALVKLAKQLKPGFSFEAKFHEAYIKDFLGSCKDLGEEKEYLEFKVLFEEVKRLDEKVTLTSYKLWYELALQKPDSESIDNHLAGIYEAADDVRLRYEFIMRKFPEAKGVYELYHSLITTIFVEANQSKPAKLALSRLNSDGMAQRSSKQMHFFNEMCGIMTVDANPENFGRIMQTNDKALSIFGMQRAMFIGSDLSDYIPPSIKKNHNKKMLHFATNCKNTNIELPFNVFISNGRRHLKDCRIIAKLSALESHPVFVVSIIDLPITREVAIVDDQGMIYAHSESLHQVLDLPQDRLEGEFIEDLLPIPLQSLEMFKAYEVRNRNQVVRLALAMMSVHKISLKLLFFFTDDEMFVRWKEGKHQKDIDDLTKGYRASSEAQLITELLEAKSDMANGPSLDPNSTVDHFILGKSSLNTPMIGPSSQINSDSFTRQNLLDSKHVMIQPKEDASISREAKGSPPSYLEAPRASKFGSSSDSISTELKHQQKLVAKFMSALKVSQIATFVTSLALVLASIMMLIYLIVSVQKIDQIFILEIFDTISQKFLVSGFASKLLVHANEGTVLYDVDMLRAKLNDASSVLRDQVSTLRNKQDVIMNYGFERLYKNNYVRNWHMFNDNPHMEIENFINVAQDFVLTTSAAARLDIEECTMTNKYIYYNYRNGLGEAFHSVNKTTYDYIVNQKELMGSVETNLLVMIGVSVGVLLVCIALVVPSVSYLQRTYDDFWEQIATLSVKRAQELKFNLVRRVNSFFDPDVIEDLEASYSDDLRSIRNGDQTLPKVKVVIWKELAVKLSVFLVISGVLFGVFFSVCFVNIKQTLEVYNERAYVASQLKLGSLSATVWIEEDAYSDSSFVDSEVPSYFFADPSLRLKEEIDILHVILKKLRESKYQMVEFGKKSMLREDFGSTSPYFHFGVHPALVNLFNDIQIFAETPISTEDLVNLIEICFELEGLEDQIFQSIVDATKTQIQAKILQAEVITVGYSIAVLILIFVVYKRMYDSLGKKLTRTLSILRLIL